MDNLGSTWLKRCDGNNKSRVNPVNPGHVTDRQELETSSSQRRHFDHKRSQCLSSNCSPKDVNRCVTPANVYHMIVQKMTTSSCTLADAADSEKAEERESHSRNAEGCLL